jgi:hypothetical protein
MSARLTPKLASFIKWYAANTQLLQHEIAARLVNDIRAFDLLSLER